MWGLRNLTKLINAYTNVHSVRYLSNKAAWITKIKRKKYLRVYPTCLVKHDGSTFTVRHFEPRRIIKLPLDISTVSEEERQKILENRKPKQKVAIEEEIEDNFDSNIYLKILQN